MYSVVTGSREANAQYELRIVRIQLSLRDANARYEVRATVRTTRGSR